MPMHNVGYVPLLFAEGGIPSLEQQAIAPILAHNEFNMTQSDLEARLSFLPEYRPLFQDAFGNEQVTLQRVIFALASFERTLLSGNSAFDRWNRGNNTALSIAAQRGEALFFGETGDCWHCHNGFNFTTNSFHNTGLDSNTFKSVGDATLLGHYIFELPALERTTVLLGGGIKVPTGLSTLVDGSGRRLDTRFQSGTGSWDFILNPMILLSQSGFTCAFELFAKLNTAGASGDRLGHSLSGTATLSHDVFRNNASQAALISIIGARLETKSRDWISGRVDIDSGFTSLYAQAGGQVVFYFFKLDFLVLLAVHQSRSALAMNEQTRFFTGARIEF
ncbi:MAG: cytochrome-c peroxidase [Chlorobiales bacterium]